MKALAILLLLATSAFADETILLDDARLHTWPTVNGQYTMHHFEVRLTGPGTFYFPVGLPPNVNPPPWLTWKRKLNKRFIPLDTNADLFNAGWHSDTGYYMVGLVAKPGTQVYHFAIFIVEPAL